VSTTPSARTRLRPGDEVDVRVDDLAHGGAGVARLDGYVVFVRGAVPGDRVRARVTKGKRAYAEALAVEVLEPSRERIPPRADHPGAPWQVLPYERQLEVKQQQVEDALRRIGKLDGVVVDPIVPAVEQWRYRNKLEFSFGTGPDGELLCGFHAPGSWEDIVGVEDCLLQSERGNEVRRAALAWCREAGLTAWDRRTQAGLLRNLVVREGRRTGDVQVRLVTSDQDVDLEGFALATGADSVVWTRVAGVAETTDRGVDEVLHGEEAIDEELAGLTFRLSVDAFFQTNTEMAERLYAIAGELAGLRGHERVYDLFCGIGTIGLTLAARAGEVWGLEVVEPAVADAIANARRNQVDNARFFAGDARIALRALAEEAGRPDVVVVDPPRAGLSQKVVRRIVETAPKRIVYVSCNPTTLAPNAAQLVEAGYVLGRVQPVDMFPQTHHVETVAVFDAGPAGVANPPRE
jgi:23S rRNA (uracil1939-C5)-methyltransferase